MPIHEPDPWRVQYFEHANCPQDVDIPTDDPDSWRWYTDHRWVYDKIAVALSQGHRNGLPRFTGRFRDLTLVFVGPLARPPMKGV